MKKKGNGAGVRVRISRVLTRPNQGTPRTHLVDPTLLRRNLGQRLSEHKDVINAEGSDSRGDGRGNDVGRVVGSADANFEDRSVDL